MTDRLATKAAPRWLGVLCVAVTLAACGSGEDDADSADSTSSAATSTDSTGVTWQYLQSQYSKVLTTKCGPNDHMVATLCVSPRTRDLQSFERDVQSLPPSKARADVLGYLSNYAKYASEFDKGWCFQTPNSASCMVNLVSMDTSVYTMQLVVDREAAK